jgi:t-SNARE complex subunit (syntaxin)
MINFDLSLFSEMTMALYFSVQEQNELTDNIWLNTSAGSDYIAQSVDEFRLVKNFKQSKMNLWIKLICVTFCFVLILLFILTLILIINQK